MIEKELTASEQWLEARAPGFLHLPDLDRRAIYDFAFLWSLFEVKIIANFACANRVRERINAWALDGTLEPKLYDAELAYFRNRYFADGALTYHLHHLNLRPSAIPISFRRLSRARTPPPRDRILALLMIVWRLRNNLFHGAKWAYELRDQRANFRHANGVLMRILERHGRLG